MGDDSAAVSILAQLGLDYTPAIIATEQFTRRLEALNKQIFAMGEAARQAVKGVGVAFAGASTGASPVGGSGTKTNQTQEDLIRLNSGILLTTRAYGQLTDAEKAAQTASKDYSKEAGTVADVSKKVGDTTDKTNNQLTQFGAALQRRLGWFIAGKMFYGTINLLKNLVKEFSAIESQMVVIERVSSEVNFQYDEMKTKLLDLGVAYGQTWDTVSDVAIKWAQAGYNMQDTITLTEKSLLALNVAELNSKMATEGLIAIMAQWGFSAKDLSLVIDKLNITADRYAVTTTDLVEALQRSSGTAQAMNLTFDETLGMITTMRTSSGRLGREVGNALSTILSYITRISTLQVLADNGINVYANSAKTKLKPAIDIIGAIAEKWSGNSDMVTDEMITMAESAGLYSKELATAIDKEEEWNDLQKIGVETAVAGVRRRNYLIGLMRNFVQVQEVMNDLEYASGYSIRENTKAMDTLQKKTEALKASMTKLADVVGSGGLLTVLTMGSDALLGMSKAASGAGKDIMGLVGTVATITTLTVALQLLAKQFEVLKGFSGLKFGWVVAIATAIGLTVELISKIHDMEQADIDTTNAVGALGMQYNDLNEKLSKMIKGSEEYNKTAKKLQEVTNQIGAAQASLVVSYDDMGNVMELNSVNLGKQIDKYRDLNTEISALTGNYANASEAMKEYLIEQLSITDPAANVLFTYRDEEERRWALFDSYSSATSDQEQEDIKKAMEEIKVANEARIDYLTDVFGPDVLALLKAPMSDVIVFLNGYIKDEAKSTMLEEYSRELLVLRGKQEQFRKDLQAGKEDLAAIENTKNIFGESLWNQEQEDKYNAIMNGYNELEKVRYRALALINGNRGNWLAAKSAIEKANAGLRETDARIKEIQSVKSDIVRENGIDIDLLLGGIGTSWDSKTLDAIETSVVSVADKFVILNAILDANASKIALLDSKQQRLYGPALANSIKAENILLQARLGILERIQEQNKSELKELKTGLSGFGFTFDADGFISNYNVILDGLALVSQGYREGSEEAQAALDNYEKAENMAAKYITVLASDYGDIAVQIQDTKNLIADNNDEIVKATEVTYDYADAVSKLERVSRFSGSTIEDQIDLLRKYASTAKLTYNQVYDLQDEMSEKYLRLLEDQHEQLKNTLDSEIESIQDSADSAVEALRGTIEGLQDELDALDEESETHDYETEMARLEKERAYWSVRTGREAAENLARIEEEIKEKQYDRNEELRRNEIQDEIDANEDEIARIEKEAQDKIDALQDAYDLIEIAFEDHAANITAYAGTMAESAFDAWNTKYFIPLQEALESGDFGAVSGIMAGFAQTSQNQSIFALASSIVQLKQRWANATTDEARKTIANEATVFYNQLSKIGEVDATKQIGIGWDIYRMLKSLGYEGAAAYVGTLPQAHTGAEVMSYGAAELRPGELVFPPDLSSKLQSLIGVLTGQSQGVINQNKSINIENLLHIDKNYMEDDVDASLLSKEIYRAILNVK